MIDDDRHSLLVMDVFGRLLRRCNSVGIVLVPVYFFFQKAFKLGCLSFIDYNLNEQRLTVIYD